MVVLETSSFSSIASESPQENLVNLEAEHDMKLKQLLELAK